MSPTPKSHRPVASQRPTPPPPVPTPTVDGSTFSHEMDEPTHDTATAPDPVIAQAKRDIDAGQVDTDMRATPGLDATRRARLVPGAGGKPPGSDG